MKKNKLKDLFFMSLILPATFTLSACGESPEYEYLPEECRSYDQFVDVASSDIFEFMSSEYDGISRENYYNKLGEVQRLEVEVDDPSKSFSFNGIQCFTSINAIELSGRGIKDIGPLASLQTVQEIEIVGTDISTIQPFLNYSLVQSLSLRNNKLLSSVQGIENMQQLEVLELPGNGLDDANVTSFSSLTKLVSLDLTGNNISDFGALGDIQTLETLILDDNDTLADLSNVTIDPADFSALKNISIANSRNLITDASKLNTIETLETINLDGNNVTTVSFIDSIAIPGLTSVSLRNNGYTDLNGFANLSVPSTLVSLDLSQNKDLTDITGLETGSSDFSNITTLDLHTDPTFDHDNDTDTADITIGPGSLTSTNGLQNFIGLTDLDLSNLMIDNITFLESLNSLQSLNLSDNNLSDASLTALSNPISDGGTNVLAGLVILDFGNKLDPQTPVRTGSNSISNLTKISNHSKITTIDLTNVPITSISNFDNLEKLANLVFGDGVDNVSNVSSITNSFNNFDDYISGTSHDTLTFDFNTSALNITNSFSSINGLTAIELANEDINVIDALSFNNLTSLAALDISENNAITTVDFIKGIGSTGLRNVIINDLSLTTIDGYFKNLTNLQSVDLSSNLSSLTINDSFKSIPKATIIDLSGSSITSITDSFTTVGSSSNQTDINLSNNDISTTTNSFITVYTSSTGIDFTNAGNGGVYTFDASFNDVIGLTSFDFSSFGTMNSVSNSFVYTTKPTLPVTIDLSSKGITNINDSFKRFKGAVDLSFNAGIVANTTNAFDGAELTSLDLSNNNGGIDLGFLSTNVIPEVETFIIQNAGTLDLNDLDPGNNINTLDFSGTTSTLNGFNMPTLTSITIGDVGNITNSFTSNHNGLTTINLSNGNLTLIDNSFTGQMTSVTSIDLSSNGSNLDVNGSFTSSLTLTDLIMNNLGGVTGAQFDTSFTNTTVQNIEIVSTTLANINTFFTRIDSNIQNIKVSGGSGIANTITYQADEAKGQLGSLSGGPTSIVDDYNDNNSPKLGSSHSQNQVTLAMTNNGQTYNYNISVDIMDTKIPTTPVITENGFSYNVDGWHNGNLAYITWINNAQAYRNNGTVIDKYQYRVRDLNTSSYVINWTDINVGANDRMDFNQSTAASGFNLRDGNYRIELKVIDEAGNESNIESVVVKVDTINPGTSTHTGYSSGTWTNQNVILNLNSSDSNSGVKKFECRVNGGAESDCSSAYSHFMGAEQNNNIEYRAVDYSGNTGPWSSVVNVRIDKTSPDNSTTTPSTGSFGGWVSSNVSGTITPGSVANGSYNSPLDKVEFRFTNGGSWTESLSYTATQEGTYNIEIRTTDEAGNSTIQTYTIQIDKTGPTAPNVTGGTSGQWYNSDLSLNFNGSTDLLEGSVTYEYDIDGSNTWLTATPLNISNTSVIRVRAVDGLGNKGPITTFNANIDKVNPNGFTITGATNNGWYNASRLLNFSTIDTGGSGIDEYRCSTDNFVSDNVPCTTYNITSTTTLTVRAYDNAGNYSESAITVNIDIVNPYRSIGPVDGSLESSDFSLTFNDDDSGIATITYTIDGGSSTPYTNGTTLSTEGVYVFTVTDNAGNTYTHNVTLDKTGPTSSLDGDTNVTNGANFLFSDNISAVGNIIVNVTGGTAGVSGVGALVHNQTLTIAGTYTVELTDEAGHTTIINFTVLP